MGLSLILGLIAINGSLTPLLMHQPEQLLTPGGAAFLLAIGIMLLGLAVCAVAGRQKEKAQALPGSGQQAAAGRRRSFRVGLLFCILSGLLSGLVNLLCAIDSVFCFHYGGFK